MPRLDIRALWPRKKPSEQYAQRDATLAAFAQTDGYKALLDLYEREMRAVFVAWLTETDGAKVREARAFGRALWTLIRRVDEKSSTVQRVEAAAEFAKRMVAEMPTDRQELADLDSALFEQRLSHTAGDVRRHVGNAPLGGVY